MQELKRWIRRMWIKRRIKATAECLDFMRDKRQQLRKDWSFVEQKERRLHREQALLISELTRV